MNEQLLQDRALALRELARAEGLSVRHLAESGIGPDLFAAQDVETGYRVILRSIELAGSSRAVAALANALNLPTAGRAAAGPRTLSRRRDELSHAEGTSTRTLMRLEREGAEAVARQVEAAVKDVARQAAGSTNASPVDRAAAKLLRIGVLDESPLVGRGTALAIEEAAPDVSVASATTLNGLLESGTAPLEVVLMDLPRRSGDESQIAQVCDHGARVVIFTDEERRVPLLWAMSAGAAGVVSKRQPVVDLVAGVRRIALDPSAVIYPPEVLEPAQGPPILSPRQVAILSAISQGLPYREVARALNMSESTVREHLNRAVASYRRAGFDVGNSHGLVTAARRDGYLLGTQAPARTVATGDADA